MYCLKWATNTNMQEKKKQNKMIIKKTFKTELKTNSI